MARLLGAFTKGASTRTQNRTSPWDLPIRSRTAGKNEAADLRVDLLPLLPTVPFLLPLLPLRLRSEKRALNHARHRQRRR